ncbi:MAG: MBOAT family O-acyltransferase [Bacteroidota bacterium]
MLFNSLTFAIFFPIVFLLYWFTWKDVRLWLLGKRLAVADGGEQLSGSISSPFEGSRSIQSQNILLLIASYTFYGWWDWRFLGLIALSSITDYWVGLQLGKTEEEKRRKFFLYISLGLNLGMLGLFKYFNFFVESFIDAFSVFGLNLHYSTLQLILPVGISFYTFQTLSYTLDIYRRKLEPSKDPIAFFTFVSFFPQLVAGPIERASNLLPQFSKRRKFDYEASRGALKQILWGLFKKIVIADNCAIYANQIFGSSEELSGSVLLLGGIYFAVQVYGDFSGYSDIAIGTARLLGFKLLDNFKLPYFSSSISEFWRRWHISLNTWFIDYIYTPIALKRRNWGTYGILFAILLTFTTSGLWHGANYTFVMWGFLHALALAYETLTKKKRRKWKKKFHPLLWTGVTGCITFAFVVFTDIFFRAESIGHAAQYIGAMFSADLFALPDPLAQAKFMPWVLAFFVFEWLQRNRTYILEISFLPRLGRWMVYYTVIYLIFNYGASPQSFIYFQF